MLDQSRCSVGSRKTSMSDSLNASLTLANGYCGTLVPDCQCPICFQSKRHQENIDGIIFEKQQWRIRERMKTASVALVLCLNIGVDPPDVVKIQPCSRLECWIDPSSVSVPKAMELIGANLQKQYERWQPRARYKKCHDPTVEDVKKLCTSLRRNAKEERVLFHYNGHGVPKPTANGEIWVFNKTFTQYIPLSIFDLQAWMGAPSIYVYDCSNAGIIINSFNQFAEQHEKEMEKVMQTIGPSALPMVTYKKCIHLAACSANQILPMNSQLPADLFTSCLTTPIKIALKWYSMQGKFDLVPKMHSDLIDKIPGQVNDRRTMLGELNWIFTAITDTIAWNTLPRDLFQKLFRQDLLVASLFRNFLLAERILRSHDCTPVSSPALPPCFRHPMWDAWDLVVDLALQQLPDILEKGAPYKQLPFFEEQLTAFQVWLDRESESRVPPEQLPIVLQVLLSQVHRLRALDLLARFLDLGPWAVNLALGVGIFPYVLKLLQSSAKELRPVLVFIWTKILAVDSSCQVDLVKDHKYFLSVLQDTSVTKEIRTLAAFVLSSIVKNFLLGQTGALQGSLVSICLVQLNDDDWLLRQWLAICLGQLWQNFDKARWSGVRDLAHEKLYHLLQDPVPEVRAAAVFALGTFISSVTDRSEEHANNIDRIIAITLLDKVDDDMSPLVRLELVAALQWMVILFESQFVTVYLQEFLPNSAAPAIISQSPTTHAYHQHSTHSLERNINMKRGYSSSCISNMACAPSSIPFHAIFLKLWQGIHNLSQDPFPKVAEAAQKVINFVRDSALSLITAKEATTEKCISLSVSLPPSPNTRTNYLGESPPVGLNHSEGGKPSAVGNKLSVLASGVTSKLRSSMFPDLDYLDRKYRTNSMNDEVDSSSGPSTAPVTDNHLPPGLRTMKPIVTTAFLPWAVSYFTRPGKNRYTNPVGEDQQTMPTDKNSPEYRGREWRFKRNSSVRQIALDQEAFAVSQKIDIQNWMGKTQFTPSIVKLLPYEPQIAVAYKEKVSVYDWSRNSVCSYTPVNSSKKTTSAGNGSQNQSSTQQGAAAAAASASASSRVGAIEFVNAHDVAMILVGHEDGIVRVWQEPSFETNRESSRLVTAWDALPLRASKKEIPGIVLSWHQVTQQLVVGGATRYLRIWDAEKELKVCDIPIGAETVVRALSAAPPDPTRMDLLAAGCSDGSVRIFDRRCSPNDARVRVYREHSGAILTTYLRDDQTTLVSGCSQGRMNVFDMRGRSTLHQWEVGCDVLTIAVHPSVDLVACGSSQKIAIYRQCGRTQTVLRSHDSSFMGPRVGVPSCLSFHSHKVNLAVGFTDNTVAVYGSPGLPVL